MITPWATVDDYQARYGSVTNTEMLLACLEDCTAVINQHLSGAGIDYSEPTEDEADRYMRVCRSMANRLMPTGSAFPVGVTQATVSSLGYSESVSLQATYGTPKPLDSELTLLGIPRGRVGVWSYGGLEG